MTELMSREKHIATSWHVRYKNWKYSYD